VRLDGAAVQEAMVVAALTQQGIMALLEGDAAVPPEGLKKALWVWLIVCWENDLEKVTSELAARDVNQDDAAIEGEGI
jgi:hypothetical protein